MRCRRCTPATTTSTAASAAAPKFPPASTIELLLSRGEHEMSLGTLRSMAQGGIYDQIGGGFARYAVDATWTVPHFEKMLYDNALLARAYLHGWQETGDERLRRVCCETLDWALREMRGPEGGFCAALDADSEGVEGKFYVWTEAELRDALGELYDDAVAYFRPVPWEGALVLEGRGPEPASLPEIRCKLYGARSSRVRPGLDDKRLTSWNALMIAALADAGAVLERDDYLQAAVACASFVMDELRDDDGRLLRTWKDGQARLPAYLEDHAYLLEALLTLYECTFDPRWYREAVALGDTIIERFSDPEHGGFFTTADDHERLAGAAQGPRGHPDPLGQLGRGLRSAAPGAAIGRRQVRAPCARRAAPALPARGPASACVRSPAAGRRLLSGAGARGGDRGSRQWFAGPGGAGPVSPVPGARRRRGR